MKKITTKIIGIITLASATMFTNVSYAQLEEGDIIIDLNYGIPSKGAVFAIIDAANTSYSGLETSYIGPAGLRFQYMISEDFGLGFEGNYTSRTATWSEQESNYNSTTGLYEYTDYEASLNQTIIRAMVRTSWEFVNEEKFTMNWANSLGYRKASWTVKPSNYNNSWTLGTWPLAFRTALGIRYWVAKNVGLNAELGFSGGSYMNAGLSVKL